MELLRKTYLRKMEKPEGHSSRVRERKIAIKDGVIKETKCCFRTKERMGFSESLLLFSKIKRPM